MSSPARALSGNGAQRWIEWQERGLAGDRRRAVAMKWVMALTAIALGALTGRVW